MKKRLFSIMTTFALVAGAMTSCQKDWTEDFNNLDKKVNELSTQVSALKSAVDAGSVISSVVKTDKGLTITLSDGKTYDVTNGNDGKPGEPGAPGADGTVIEINAEKGVWKINGEDTDYPVLKAEDLTKVKVPYINEDGLLVFFDEEGEEVITDIKAEGKVYAVEADGVYTLNVPDADGVMQQIKLPVTAAITSIEACTIVADQIKAATVELIYGQVGATADIDFNGKKYAKNSMLITKAVSLSAIVNPVDADAEAFNFALMNTKGEMPLAISEVKANKTVNPLTRAEATVNKGVYDMTVQYASADKCSEVAGTYALVTTTANGLVASAYNVTVTETKMTSFSCGGIKNLNDDYNKVIDLKKTFKGTAIASFNGTPVNDMYPYIVDCTYEIVDKTAAAAIGAVIDGDQISATKPGSVQVKVSALYVNGQTGSQVITVTFDNVVPTATLADVEWTITTEAGKDVVYLPLGALQSALTGASDTDLPTLQNLGWTWTDGTALDSKTVTVNGDNYGKAPAGKTSTAFTGNEASWLANVDVATLYTKNPTTGAYAATVAGTTKIQTDLYIKFAFTPALAFPGEYIVNLGFKKGNTAAGADDDYEVPVKVTITAPVEASLNPFERLAAYFNGDDAVAYGTVNTASKKVDYDLFSLYKDMTTEKATVTFTEEFHNLGDTHKESDDCNAWITTSPNISVDIYDETATGATANIDAIYSTRKITATYVVFGNPHIANVVDSFNLTLKSEIAEGTITATTATYSGNGVTPIYINLGNIVAKDVYGQEYRLRKSWKYDATKKVYVEPKSGDADYNDYTRDSRIQSVEPVLVDDNAKEYLSIATFGGATSYFTKVSTDDAFQSFGFVKKSSTTALVSDVPCKVALKITDIWGKVSTIEFTVTLTK